MIAVLRVSLEKYRRADVPDAWKNSQPVFEEEEEAYLDWLNRVVSKHWY